MVDSLRRFLVAIVGVALAATMVHAGGTAGAAVPRQAAASSYGEYTPLTPARIVDTRNGIGGRLGKLGAGEQFDIAIDGQGGVPATGVSAVVVNVTVDDPTAASYLTIWPKGVPRPTISNLNYGPGLTVANLVTVAVLDGGVSAYNNAGATHVIFDVVGYYADDLGPAGSRFHSLPPTRLFDTRSGGGPNPSGQVVQQQVLSRAGIPASDVTGVVLNVTVTQPSSSGYVTVYPGDVGAPTASNLNYVAGATVPNLVEVRVPASGVVDFLNITNNGGAVFLLADVVGYYDGDKTTEAGRLAVELPDRLIDTRVESPAPPPGCIAGGDSLVVQFLNPYIDSVVLNVTVTQPTASGFLTAYPLPPPAPLASTLNFVPGQTVPNLAIVKLGQAGATGYYVNAGCTHVILDAFGFFTNAAAPSPDAPSTTSQDRLGAVHVGLASG